MYDYMVHTADTTSRAQFHCVHLPTDPLTSRCASVSILANNRRIRLWKAYILRLLRTGTRRSKQKKTQSSTEDMWKAADHQTACCTLPFKSTQAALPTWCLGPRYSLFLN
eukprot:527053-Pelagomonas_calceolata.AAC.2